MQLRIAGAGFVDLRLCSVGDRTAGGTHTSPHCGAVHAVTIERLPAHDKDDAFCEVYGELMAGRNDTEVSALTRITGPNTRRQTKTTRNDGALETSARGPDRRSAFQNTRSAEQLTGQSVIS